MAPFASDANSVPFHPETKNVPSRAYHQSSPIASPSLTDLPGSLEHHTLSLGANESQPKHFFACLLRVGSVRAPPMFYDDCGLWKEGDIDEVRVFDDVFSARDRIPEAFCPACTVGSRRHRIQIGGRDRRRGYSPFCWSWDANDDLRSVSGLGLWGMWRGYVLEVCHHGSVIISVEYGEL